MQAIIQSSLSYLAGIRLKKLHTHSFWIRGNNMSLYTTVALLSIIVQTCLQKVGFIASRIRSGNLQEPVLCNTCGSPADLRWDNNFLIMEMFLPCQF